MHTQHCQRGLTWPHQQTSDAPGPCCVTAHGHNVMGGIGTPFIYISNVLWENRAPTSLSLAGTTLVLFNVSFHKLLSSKQPIFFGQGRVQEQLGLYSYHTWHTQCGTGKREGQEVNSGFSLKPQSKSRH